MIDRNTLLGPTSRLAGIHRRIDRAAHAWTARRDLSTDRRDVPRILAAIAPARPDATSWAVRGGHGGEPTVLIVGPRRAAPTAVIRIARSPAAQAGLDRAATALEQLHGQLASLEVDRLLPVPIGRGVLAGRAWAAESALPGRPARPLVAQAESRRRLLVATARVIGRIHAATERAVVVDDALVERWVSTRISVVAETLARQRPARPGSPLAKIEAALSTDLRGRTLSAGWIHGDLWPANLLVSGEEQAISGIVDWDSAGHDELALHDRLHLAITTRRLVERRELGPVLAGLLTGGAWTDDDRAVLESPAGDGTGPGGSSGGLGAPAAESSPNLPDHTSLWLYWLRFVESNLRRHPDLATDRTWLALNVEQVLACA